MRKTGAKKAVQKPAPARQDPLPDLPAVPTEPAHVADENADSAGEGMGAATPLDYMLSVMRDPAVEAARRDEMAKLALPYLHPKPAAIEHTGKDGGPIEIADVSETDIARRISFIFARAGQGKVG